MTQEATSSHTPRITPLSVVVYTDALGIGGAEISLGHLVANVSDAIDLTVVGVSESVVAAIAARRSTAVPIVLPANGISTFTAHLFTFSQRQPVIIHLNLCTPWACAVALSAALMLPHTRVVRVDQLPLRTTDAWTLWRTRWLSLRVDAHVTVGQHSARKLEDFYALGRDTVLSIPNGVPVGALEPKSLGINPEVQMVVGCIGRLDAMKGYDILLRAIAQVEGIRVVILGEGEQRCALVQLARELGIGDRLTLRGWVQQPWTYLPEFDIVALPSRSEGFPLAMVEAMLAARPIIATRVGSISEAITEGETGLLIDKDDVAGLAKALVYLRDHAAVRERLGQQAQCMAKAHFTAEAMAKRYEQLWHQLLAKPRQPRIWIPRPRD